jgi:hypothetical protein
MWTKQDLKKETTCSLLPAKQEAARSELTRSQVTLIVWKHCGVLLRVPIGQDIVVIGNGVVVVLLKGVLPNRPE